jgi:hypothetical protein
MFRLNTRNDDTFHRAFTNGTRSASEQQTRWLEIMRRHQFTPTTTRRATMAPASWLPWRALRARLAHLFLLLHLVLVLRTTLAAATPPPLSASSSYASPYAYEFTAGADMTSAFSVPTVEPPEDSPEWTKSFVENVDDYPFERVSLPFTFPYFDGAYTDVYISPNGALHFDAQPPCCSNSRQFAACQFVMPDGVDEVRLLAKWCVYVCFVFSMSVCNFYTTLYSFLIPFQRGECTL